jgi:NADH:ubiquinone oxidoreductase subunit K
MGVAMNPTTGPALEYVRALPWAPSILAVGGAAALLAAIALTRRHPGEAVLIGVASSALLFLVFAEIGQGALGIVLLAIAIGLAAAASIVAFAVRAVPGAPRVAPGNEQRVLALAVVALLTGAWLVSGLAVDWPEWEPGTVSALATALVLTGVGVFGLLTRRHWLSLVLSAQCVAAALTLAAAALPDGLGQGFALLFASWDLALAAAGLALAGVALRRGHGPWVDAQSPLDPAS